MGGTITQIRPLHNSKIHTSHGHSHSHSHSYGHNGIGQLDRPLRQVGPITADC